MVFKAGCCVIMKRSVDAPNELCKQSHLQLIIIVIWFESSDKLFLFKTKRDYEILNFFVILNWLWMLCFKPVDNGHVTDVLLLADWCSALPVCLLSLWLQLAYIESFRPDTGFLFTQKSVTLSDLELSKLL